MSGFTGSSQEQTLKRYLRYLIPEIIDASLEYKISRTKRDNDRAKFEGLLQRSTEFLEELQLSINCDEPLSDEAFFALHQIGSIAETFANREVEQMKNIISGRAFNQLPQIQGQENVVWGKFDQEKMRSSAHPLQSKNKSKI